MVVVSSEFGFKRSHEGRSIGLLSHQPFDCGKAFSSGFDTIKQKNSMILTTHRKHFRMCFKCFDRHAHIIQPFGIMSLDCGFAWLKWGRWGHISGCLCSHFNAPLIAVGLTFLVSKDLPCFVPDRHLNGYVLATEVSQLDLIAATYAEFFDYSLQIHTPSGPGFTVRVFEGDVETAAI